MLETTKSLETIVSEYRATRVLPRHRDEGVVYFIQQGHRGPVKIGWTTSPTSRRDKLQPGNPKPLYIVATFPGCERVEGIVHRYFAEFHIYSEWFKADVLKDPYVQASLEKHKFGPPLELQQRRLARRRA